jgi:WD40 repeat protein
VAKKLGEFRDQYYVSALAFNGDGTQLAVNFMVEGDEVHVWEWRGASHIVQRLKKPGGAGDGYALSYSPDSKLLAVRYDMTNEGKVIRVWNAKTGEIIHDVIDTNGQGSSGGFAFSPDSSLLIRTINRSNSDALHERLIAHRTGTWERVWGLNTIPFQPRVVAVSPDGKLAALGGEAWIPNAAAHPQILIVDLIKNQIVRTIDGASPDSNTVLTLVWSPDGLDIAAGCRIGGSFTGPDAVRIFDVATGKRVGGVPASSSTVTGLSYSPNGKYLIAGSVDNGVQILDGHNYALLQNIRGDARSLAISRDGRYLAVAEVRNISIWELR